MTTKSPEGFEYKIIILGEPSVGKTSLIKRLVENKFKSDEELSVGVNIFKKDFYIDDHNIILILWDIEEVSEMFQMEDFYFEGAKGIVIVYDVTNPESLRKAINWCKRCTEHGLVHMPRILIGNKIDLENKRSVSIERGGDVADKIRAIHYETSALKGENVLKAFTKITKLVYNLHGII